MHLRQWISNFHACQLRDDSSSAASTLRSQPLFRSAVDTYLGDDEKKNMTSKIFKVEIPFAIAGLGEHGIFKQFSEHIGWSPQN